MFSEEAPKPEDTTDATKSADAREAETATATQGKTKKSTKEDQSTMTNIESLYFADTFLFQGLLQARAVCFNSVHNYFLAWFLKCLASFCLCFIKL